MVELLRALEGWYQSQCDENWEHKYGIKIETLDNPGWLLKVDLHGTNLAGKHFAALECRISETDWINCSIKDEVFIAAGGSYNLSQLIETFLRFAD